MALILAYRPGELTAKEHLRRITASALALNNDVTVDLDVTAMVDIFTRSSVRIQEIITKNLSMASSKPAPRPQPSKPETPKSFIPSISISATRNKPARRHY